MTVSTKEGMTLRHFQILCVFHLFHTFQIMSETLMKRSANAAQSCRKREGRAA